MKIIILILLAIILSDSKVFSAEWHVIMNESNQCEKPGEDMSQSPADMIKLLQESKAPYKVEDVKKGKNLIAVKVYDFEKNYFVTFYKGKSSCQAELNRRNKQQRDEVEKYR